MNGHDHAALHIMGMEKRVSKGFCYLEYSCRSFASNGYIGALNCLNTLLQINPHHSSC